jgi:hypothetical protein
VLLSWVVDIECSLHVTLCLMETLWDDMVGCGIQDKGRVYGVDPSMRVDV